MINSKRVAIADNLTPTVDLTQEIDNHDIVIHINHFYNYDSGLVGKKANMLFVIYNRELEKCHLKKDMKNTIISE